MIHLKTTHLKVMGTPFARNSSAMSTARSRISTLSKVSPVAIPAGNMVTEVCVPNAERRIRETKAPKAQAWDWSNAPSAWTITTGNQFCILFGAREEMKLLVASCTVLASCAPCARAAYCWSDRRGARTGVTHAKGNYYWLQENSGP
mgnify:CR=1 FL=1